MNLIDDKLVMFGGWTGKSEIVGEISVFDLTDNNWLLESSKKYEYLLDVDGAGVPSAWHTTVVTPSGLMVVGGNRLDFSTVLLLSERDE